MIDAATRRRLRDVTRRLGVEEPARRLYALRSHATRRDARDNAHLRVALAAALGPDSCCVDVGAHRGDVLAEMVRLAPHGRHVALEPIPALAADLRRRFPSVDVRDAAASDAAGEADFVHMLDEPALSGLLRRAPGRSEGIRVRTERLDDVLTVPPAFVKIDVEGAELQVLRGALRTLREHRPLVWFEHGLGAADRYGTTPGQVHDLLVGDVGLRIFDADGNGPVPRAEFEALFTAPIWTFLARP